MNPMLRFMIAVLFLSPVVLGQEAKTPSIEGKVEWDGQNFLPREVLWPIGSRGHDLALEKILVDRVIRDRRLVVDAKSRGLADVAVILDGLEMGVRRPLSVGLEIKDLEFVHRVVVVRPQGSLVLANRDPIPHRLPPAGRK